MLCPDVDAKVPLNRSVSIYMDLELRGFKDRMDIFTINFSRLTPKLADVCHKIIENEGVQRQEILEEGINVWEGETRTNTRHLNLEQVCRFLKNCL